ADHDGTLCVEPLHNGCRVRRDVSLEDARAGGRRDLLRADDVLARPRDTGEKRRVAVAEARVGRAGLGAGGVVGDVQHGVVAVGETFSVSTSASRATASSTTESCPVNRSTSSGVRAIRASPAAFSTTERSMAMNEV